MFWILKSRSLISKIKRRQPRQLRFALVESGRVRHPEIFYGFLLVCGFGSLLTLIIFPEITSSGALQSLNFGTMRIGRLFFTPQLQENQDSYEVKLMKERADFTRLSCEKDYRSLPTPRLLDRYGASRILVDDKRKILFCFIPKVACSNWKIVFLGLLGVIPKQDLNLVTDVHDSYQKYLTNLGRMSFREQQLRLTTYKKVMFVREPFVRLLSAFRNKFLDPNLAPEWFKYVDEITTFYNRHSLLPFNRTKTWNLMKAGVSFRTLLQYLVDKRNVGEKITNTHYAIYENLCQPCKVQYDYIGEFDMLEAEANALFEDLSIDFQFPLRRGNFTAVKTSDLMREYLREVPKELIQSVMALYSTDYIRYGYNTSVWLN